jgi:uncharacterized membrane protein YccC
MMDAGVDVPDLSHRPVGIIVSVFCAWVRPSPHPKDQLMVMLALGLAAFLWWMTRKNR